MYASPLCLWIERWTLTIFAMDSHFNIRAMVCPAKIKPITSENKVTAPRFQRHQFSCTLLTFKLALTNLNPTNKYIYFSESLIYCWFIWGSSSCFKLSDLMDLYCLFMAEWRFDCIIYFCGSSVEQHLDLSVAFLLLTLTQSGLLLLVKKEKIWGA